MSKRLTSYPAHATTIEGQRVVLMAEPLFDEYIRLLQQHEGKSLTVEWGEKKYASVVYYEPTIYETDPHPDPLSVGQED